MKVGKIIKTVLLLCLAAFFAFILVRILMQSDTRTLRELYPTENARSAFEKEGEDAFSYHKMSSEISSDGYFSAYGMVYCKSTGELQLTARYNDSLMNKYLDGADEDGFRWVLYDSEGNILSDGKILDKAKKYQYNYVRIAFENVEADENTDIMLRLICEEKDYPDEDKIPNFYVHFASTEFEKYDLSAKERKLFEK